MSKNWKESSFIAENVGALSAEVRDLLDRIFVVDPSKRITLAQIMQHPWFNRRLSAKYQQALDRQAKQQAELDRHVQMRRIDQVGAAYIDVAQNESLASLVHVESCSKQLMQAKLRERNQALDKMAAAAAEAGHDNPQKSGLRPLHMLDMSHADLITLDLRCACVLIRDVLGRFEVCSLNSAPQNAADGVVFVGCSEAAVLEEGSVHAKGESPVVQERFGRGSVAEVVENAFNKSNGHDMDVVREKMAERNRAPIGGGML